MSVRASWTMLVLATAPWLGVTPSRADPPPLRMVRAIPAPEAGAHWFGAALAAPTDAQRLLVGAPLRSDGEVNTGVVYSYDLAACLPELAGALVNPAPSDPPDLFGWSVAVANGSALVGAPTASIGATTAAGVVHQLSPYGGTSLASHQPANPLQSGHFGAALARFDGGEAGEFVIVGHPGAAEAYRVDPQSGTVHATYQAQDPTPKAFAHTLAAAADKVVIGDYEGGSAVEVFDGMTGAFLGAIDAPSLSAGAFGAALAAYEDDLLVASYKWAAGGGAAYRIDLDTGQVVTTFANPDANAGFGGAIARIGDAVAVSGLGVGNVGVVHLFDATSGALVQTIDNPDPTSRTFGYALAAKGRTLFVSTLIGPDDGPGVLYAFAPCGDDVVDAGESCDDGNGDDGDGCSSQCQPEATPTGTYDGNVVAWSGQMNAPEIIPSYTPPDANGEMTFSAVVSDPCGREIVACGWNFGDGSPPVWVDVEDGACAPTAHTYAHPGAYHAVVQATTAPGPVGQLLVDVDAAAPFEVGAEETASIGISDSLVATIKRPTASGARPTIVEYSPYVHSQFHLELDALVRSGYNVVHVTRRGHGASQGAPDMFGLVDQADLLRIDQWLYEQSCAAEPWANGEYCLVGQSGPANVGALAVARQVPAGHPPCGNPAGEAGPSNLKCGVFGDGLLDVFGSAITKNGAPFPMFVVWVANTFFQAAADDPGVRIPAYIDFGVAAHARTRTAYWQDRDARAGIAEAEVPLLLFTSTDDGVGGTELPYLDQADSLADPRSAVVLYMGPHVPFDVSLERPTSAFPRDRTILTREARQFLDVLLQGRGTLDTDEYNVRYAILAGGPQAAFVNALHGGWGASEHWPPEDMVPLTLHLDTGTPSATVDSRADHSLSPTAAGSGAVTFGYQPPPLWPVFTGGVTLNYTFPDARAINGAAITFTSGPMTVPITAGGKVTLHLRAKSTLYDWSWMAVLEDVWPDGSAHWISSGLLRASAKDGLSTYAPPTRDQFHDYTIPLSSVVNVLGVDHRLRLSLYQMSTNDSDPASRSTVLDAASSRLELSRVVGADFPQAATCTGCPVAQPNEAYGTAVGLTVGYEGDVEHDETTIHVRLFGLVADLGEAGRYARFLVQNGTEAQICEGGTWTGDVLHAATTGITVSLSCDGGASSYEIALRCDTEGDSGEVELLDPPWGEIQRTDGRVQCYDVPILL